MQESIATPSTHETRDFAGILAALAAARRTEPPAWSEEELPHDVATLSYERALQTHARYRPANDDLSVQQPYPADEVAQRRDGVPAEPVDSFTSINARDRKCASITIRMSKAECEQLKQRAAEAGLTISAYLRSCTFEAEALRAQVKDALADLRKAKAPVGLNPHKADAQAASGESVRSPRLGWLRRLVSDPHPGRHLGRA